MHIVLNNGWEDKEFISSRTEGFEEFKAVVDQYPPEIASQITGVPIEQLNQAAEILATNKPMAVMWAMGITQHIVGVRNVMSLANLQMLLGNMGVPGEVSIRYAARTTFRALAIGRLTECLSRLPTGEQRSSTAEI